MKGVTMEQNIQQLAALKKLLDLPHNKQCADCVGGGGAARASWASINIGVFICMRCAGIHRGLGVHVSKVSFDPCMIPAFGPHAHQICNVVNGRSIGPSTLWPGTNACVPSWQIQCGSFSYTACHLLACAECDMIAADVQDLRLDAALQTPAAASYTCSTNVTAAEACIFTQLHVWPVQN